MKPNDGENVDSFARRLRMQTSLCGFGELKDTTRTVLFCVVSGVSNSTLIKRLLKDSQITL